VWSFFGFSVLAKPDRSAEKFLIVTADDFGVHEAVNEAVEQASLTGILTAASLMVGAPAAVDAIRRARALPNLALGLHLVLADGCAMLPPDLIPDLADGAGRMNSRMFVNGVRFAAFPGVRRHGLALDHVNVHKHFHLHPTLLEMLLRIGRDYGMPAVRVPDEPLWFAARGGDWLSGVRRTLLAPWVALMKRRLRIAKMPHNDHIFGVAASGAMDETKLLAILERLPPGVSEIYLHPATQSGSAIAATMGGYRHADELAALQSPRVRAAVAAGDFGRGGYADVRRER
jgi:hopanoid biosynthesis associated protein HpnK